MNEAGAIVNELVASGEWVGGEGLADPATAASVRVRDGVPAVTDGPFAEAKEQIVGYCIVDCDSKKRAVEIATPVARCAIVGHGGATHAEPGRGRDVIARARIEGRRRYLASSAFRVSVPACNKWMIFFTSSPRRPGSCSGLPTCAPRWRASSYRR